ncbi:MAG: ATP-binding protein, partial [Spirochaetia bacterium]|nr:ATP-binding protein [Spirochaetia bacterium]
MNTTGTRNYFFTDTLVQRQVEYIALFTFMIFLLFFLSWLFYKKFTKFSIGYAIFAGTLSLIILFATYSTYEFLSESILAIFQASLMVYMPYALYLIGVQVREKNPDAIRLMVGAVIITICAIHDIMVARDYFHNFHIAKYGFFIVIMGIAAILAGRYTRAFDESDRLNEELKTKNRELEKTMLQVEAAKEHLEEKVEERTSELQDAYTRLQETDALKTSFFANITHEIRTPLTLIMSPIERMLQDEAVRSKYESEIQTMRNNSLRLLKLITHILEIARIDSSKNTIKPLRIELKKFINETLKQFQPSAESRKLSLDFNCRHERVMFVTDILKFEMILMNLLSNAIKFTAKGEIQVTLDKENEYACISVKDTGIGISRENRSKIFERFIQLDHGSDRRFEGSGIGLALSAELAESLGGEILLDSNEGGGSIFTIRLPSLQESHLHDDLQTPDQNISEQFLAELEEEPTRIDSENNKKEAPIVLVVEDKTDMRNHIITVLDGYHIIEAANGKDALDKLLSGHIDIIVSDIMMPEMDGFELILQMDKNPELRHIPLVFLTALDEDGSRFRGLYSGAVYYLTKPFAAEELKAAVSSALKRTEILNGKVRTERKKIFEDIHDDLVSYVTDLLHLSNEIQKRELNQKEKTSLIKIAKKISEGIRGQLINYERLVLLNQDFSLGLHLTLLDRYTLKNRT